MARVSQAGGGGWLCAHHTTHCRVIRHTHAAGVVWIRIDPLCRASGWGAHNYSCVSTGPAPLHRPAQGSLTQTVLACVWTYIVCGPSPDDTTPGDAMQLRATAYPRVVAAQHRCAGTPSPSGYTLHVYGVLGMQPALPVMCTLHVIIWRIFHLAGGGYDHPLL